jgi:hypothetical protein
MSAGASGYEIEFPEGYFGQLEEDTPARGWLEVTVRATDGKTRYRLAFYDAVRLKQTLDDYAEQGKVHYAEPNLVLLTEVSTANVQKAVAELAREGYFDQIKAEAALS